MSINKVVITGNLTRDPELRETPSGFQVLSFGVAVNDRRRNPQTQQWEDYANFVDCTMFRQPRRKRVSLLEQGQQGSLSRVNCAGPSGRRKMAASAASLKSLSTSSNS